MKVLQLCKKFPYPLKDGESIAVNSLSKALCNHGCDITLLAMNTTKHFFSETRNKPVALKHYENIYTVKVDNRVKPLDALTNLFSPDSYHITRFISLEFKDKLAQLLRNNDYDVIQLETPYLAPYIPLIRQYTEAPIAMRAHNVEHEIWQRITENTSFFLKKWYLTHLTKKLKDYELAQLSYYDLLVAITQRDLNTFRSLGFKKQGIVTPIGLEMDQYMADYSSYQRPLSISFIGSLDWMPNQEGIKWFLEKVWPKADKKMPGVKLHVAGRNTPDWLLKMRNRNIEVHGEVPNATEFINQHSVMVVPLLSGSGMRAKILEGMALGKVVISTKLGLEGIPAKHRRQVLVADSPEEFIMQLQYCQQLPTEQLRQMGEEAQDFAHKHYDSQETVRALMKRYQELMVGAL
ncbi:MAG: glycosyltransferase family 4 protein [Saprospiraceae bacterium]|nr:glycosyltransferase family 4 protein [Saprospiraceae bacterium]